MKKRNPLSSLEYGVTVVEGMPGSGKSFMCVRSVADEVARTRRPVYTNLPLNWRRMRAYLRKLHGADVAKLVYLLEEPHFRRFAKRFADQGDFKSRLRDFRSTACTRLSEAEIDARWKAEAGPDITDGPDANWIPYTAFIIIDEAHMWFPMKHGTGTQAEDVQRMLSMHRHGLYKVWFVTQDRSMLDIALRRLMAKVVQVRNLGDDCLAWSIKFKHLGIRGMGYSAFTREQLEARSLDVRKPIDNYVILSQLPWYQVFFSLYQSFTHVASADELKRTLDAERKRAGLDDAPQNKQTAVKPMSTPPESRRVRSMKYAKWFLIPVVLLLVMAIGIALGRSNGSSQQAQTAPGTPVVLTWPKFQGGGPGVVYLDGKRLKNGDRIGDIEVVDVAEDGTGFVCVRGGDVWLWAFKDKEPRRIGEERFVRAALAAAATRGRPAVDRSAKRESSAVESSSRDLPR